ncbi:MAG TPA: hypothetical protein VKA57_16275 [Solirubrobacteraceae bacterium]|nr:hypothetical protein [Solirubrobacteraceae bacterium]
MTDLQTAVDQLHAVPLEDFVAERKRLAKELRSGGDRDAAAELAKLPKPSAPAWALNHVAREEPAAVADWLGATGALRDASTHADRSSGDALRAAMAAHREATRQLLATVREQARPNGRPLTEPMLDRVRDLLQAATADEARAELLRAGRVVEGDDEPALPAPDGKHATQPDRSSKRRSVEDRGAEDGASEDRTAEDRAAADEQRAAKEREAREAAERAELERLVADVEARVAELRDAADERAAAVASAEERLEEAQRTLHRTESEVAAAREAADEAADAAEHAERELRTLTAKLSS